MENVLNENNNIIGMIPPLRDRVTMISVEDGMLISKVNDYFTDQLSGIIKLFSINEDRVASIDVKDYNAHAKEMMKQKTALRKILKDGDFLKVQNIEVPVMLGMAKNMVDSVNLLHPAIEAIRDNLFKVVDDCDTVIAKTITDSDYKKSTKPIKIPRELIEEADLLRETLNKLIDPSSTIDRKAIKELLPNISCLQGVFDKLKSMGDVSTVKNLDEIKEITKKTGERVNTLHSELKENDDQDIDRSKLYTLADYLDITARYVTTAISLLHIVNQLSNMNVEILKAIEKKL